MASAKSAGSSPHTTRAGGAFGPSSYTLSSPNNVRSKSVLKSPTERSRFVTPSRLPNGRSLPDRSSKIARLQSRASISLDSAVGGPDNPQRVAACTPSEPPSAGFAPIVSVPSTDGRTSLRAVNAPGPVVQKVDDQSWP